MKRFTDFYKQAAALLTPQAQAAATAPQGGAPMDPAAMGGMSPQGDSMDPAMMGGAPIPPAGGMPMDPSMMGGMPPQGAPMDPAAMQGMPADPAAMGGMPQGAPQGAWMQDPQFLQFLQQMGIQIDPQSGMAMGPDGQPIPPQLMDQMYAEFQNQMAAAQQGGMPPQQGMPPEGQMPPQGQMPQPGLDEQTMNNMASIIMDSVDSVLEQKMATLDKKLTAFAQKLDSIKSLIDDLALGTNNMQKQQQLQNDKLNAELEEQLKTIQDLKAQPVQNTEDILKSAAQQKPGRSILDIMRG